MTKQKVLRDGAPVTITTGRNEGYSGRIADRDRWDRFYTVEVTHGPNGNRLNYPFMNGLYSLKELRHNNGK